MQMGLIDVNGAFPNFTKCSTWKNIKKSHTSAKLVELLLRDVYGMLILLSIGLIGSALGLAVEKAVGKESQVQEPNLQGQEGEKVAGPGVSRQKLVTEMMGVWINRAEELNWEEGFELK